VIIQIVRYRSGLTRDEVDQRFRDRAGRYREVPGLLQKYYVAYPQAEEYGGICVWDSEDSLQAWKAGDLSGTLDETYEVVGEASRETADVMLVLHPDELARS
jgi:heme-degrading monooxygenase HmoA